MADVAFPLTTTNLEQDLAKQECSWLWVLFLARQASWPLQSSQGFPLSRSTMYSKHEHHRGENQDTIPQSHNAYGWTTAGNDDSQRPVPEEKIAQRTPLNASGKASPLA
ncbi:uncharacterized protein SPSK_04699 [Sporothrix schenckii 1099-18]|uniref:Uncharacterized protein n=1 Tax=Sporothrix schenckii 1099-18 TaxID=1397361 RepID=A0A0F2M429_SPOSC|nr:uncharacterized protein SPSK_04699 [Sporothrix schenckii 1099-18]KJR83545.1 hypothetical protein SPSK_04699 [Sporothrix schenckii 1099-18]